MPTTTTNLISTTTKTDSLNPNTAPEITINKAKLIDSTAKSTTNDIGANNLLDKTTGLNTEYKQTATTSTSGHILTADGLGSSSFVPLSGGSLFGTEAQDITSGVDQTLAISAGGFTILLTLTTTLLVGGKYMFNWYSVIDPESTSSYSLSIIQDSTISATDTMTKNPSSDKLIYSGNRILVLVPGIHSFQIRLNSGSAGSYGISSTTNISLYRWL